MKGSVIAITAILSGLICLNPCNAEKIQYNFSKGALYRYSYSYNATSKAASAVSAVTPAQSSTQGSTEFTLKVVEIQDNTYIVDITANGNTYRRYLDHNGALKGTPSEDRQTLPFMIVFPSGDWSVGSTIKQSDEVVAFGGKFPITTSLTLKNVDKNQNTAEIDFSTEYPATSDKIFSKNMILKGKIIFNLTEGVVHKVDWTSMYSAVMNNKEMAITRPLWSFEKQISHSLIMKGIEK